MSSVDDAAEITDPSSDIRNTAEKGSALLAEIACHLSKFACCSSLNMGVDRRSIGHPGVQVVAVDNCDLRWHQATVEVRDVPMLRVGA
jgi:hypothetical protein